MTMEKAYKRFVKAAKKSTNRSIKHLKKEKVRALNSKNRDLDDYFDNYINGIDEMIKEREKMLEILINK